MYVVQDLSTFVKSYAAGEEIPFGKGTFGRAAVAVLQSCTGAASAVSTELITSREMALGKPCAAGEAVPLTNEQLRRVFQMLAQSIFQLTVEGETSTVRGIQSVSVPAMFSLRSAGKELELEARLPPTASSSRARDNLSG